MREATRHMFSAGCYAAEPFGGIPHLPRVYVSPSTRSLWGANFGECTTCRQTGDPAWTCPAAVTAYADIGGSDADIVEAIVVDGVSGEQHVFARTVDHGALRGFFHIMTRNEG